MAVTFSDSQTNLYGSVHFLLKKRPASHLLSYLWNRLAHETGTSSFSLKNHIVGTQKEREKLRQNRTPKRSVVCREWLDYI